MSFAAVSAIGDAIDAARAFLTPVGRSRWLRLALVVFFLSSGSTASSIPNVFTQTSIGGGVEIDTGANGFQDIPSETLAFIAAIVVVVLLVGLLYLLVGSIMEFVFVDALRKEAVTVRASFRRYIRAGLSLFLFRVLLGIAVLVPLGLLGYVLFEPLVTGDPTAGQVLGALGIFIPVALVVGILVALVHGLTVEFVVQIMIGEEEGLVAGWRDFWPTLRGNLAEIVVYVVVRWGLMFVVGIVGATVTGIAAVVVAIPFVLLVFGVLFGTGGSLTALSAVVLAVLFLVFLLIVLGIGLVVQVPLSTYTRYFELLVLGDLEPDFDLIPEQRAAVRGDDDDDGPSDTGVAGVE